MELITADDDADDLSGHRIRSLTPHVPRAGHVQITLDGRDDNDVLQAPGLFLYRLQIQSDVGTQTRQGLVALAY